MKRFSVTAICILVLLAFASAVRADGLPVAGSSPYGVAGSSERYLAVYAGRDRGTVLLRIAKNGGRPLRQRLTTHSLEVPAVAYDGSPGGLSHDGRTLVLDAPRVGYPQPTSTFFFVNPRTLSIERRLRLSGDFSFDAISPDGATLFLIELNRRNPQIYSVRALDVASGKLLPKPVIDPREADEVMRGFPVTRESSPDGRFAYTLYSGSEKPFIHALDTVGKTAKCIDIPPIPNLDPAQARLRLDGRRLTVFASGVPMAVVDTVTRRVTQPQPSAPRHITHHSSGGPSVPLIAAAAALALLVLLLAGRRLRRSREPDLSGPGPLEHLPGVEAEEGAPVDGHPVGVAEYSIDGER
jgi:hypothetical protein